MPKEINPLADPAETLRLMMSYDPWIWAVENRIRLVGGTFGKTGHEYQIEPMQSTAPVIVVRKATQLGFSEAFVLRSLHRLINGMYPLGILYLFPSKDDVTDFSTSRFKPLIDENQRAIGQYIRDTDRANLKRINRAYIYFRSGRLGQSIEGEKTSTKLKSIPVDCCVFDEWDEMDPGSQEMAVSRMQHSVHKHQGYLANPTIPDYGIDRMWQKSDQRMWVISCQHCGAETCLELEFPDCLIRKDRKVYRACKKCGREIYPKDGRWTPQFPDRNIAGYSISHLNSVFVDPTTLLDEWESEELHSNVSKLANFYRLKLGVPYIGATDRLTKQDIYDCCSTDPMSRSHPGPCALGVDIGGTIHAVIMDRPTENQSRMVYCGRFNDFNELTDIVKPFNIDCCVVDKYPETRAVREWGKSMPFRTYLCEYRESTHGFSKWDEKEMETYVNRTELCDETHELVTKPGRYVIPRLSQEIERYAAQMTNTAKVKKTDQKTGVEKYVYVKLSTEDHYRHATNYAWLASTKIGVSRQGGRQTLDLRKHRGKINWKTL